jgi:hypothetical protein
MIKLLGIGFVMAAMTSCPPLPGGGIHGHVVATVEVGDGGVFPRGLSRIELPGTMVTARNVDTGTSSAPVPTNAHGYFQVPHLDPGNYQVCAEAPGFSPSCLATNVAVSAFSVVLGDDVRVAPKLPYVAGHVLLGSASGSPCFTDRPAFRTLLQAQVTLRDGNGKVLAGPVLDNGLGEYLLPDVHPPAGPVHVVADCQGTIADAPLTISTAQTLRNLIIPNSPPRVRRIEATVAGQAVRLVPPGGTVTLHAVSEDPDGNALKFKWTDSSGVPLPGGSDTTTLTVPATASSTTVFVEASDGRGGFAYSLLPVTGSPPQDSLFAGRVVDADGGTPIVGANVTVNGKPTTSDAAGLFTVSVSADVRYAVTVHKAGYALLSKVTYAPAAELRLPLQKVVGVPFNVGEGGVIVSPESNKGSLRVALRVPPRSLVDGAGKPASGPGTAYIWGYPPNTPMPGDMSGFFGASPARLETFGALDIQLLDGAGSKLQVAPGAQLGLTLAPSALGPSVVPLFLLKEDNATWVEHGKLVRAGAVYVGPITHLSAFNADLAFITTGCMEYHVDVENSPALPFYLHIEQGGQTANHEPFQVGDFVGVVSRLRPGIATNWWALPTPTSAKADAIGSGTFTSSNFTSDPADPNGDFPAVGARDASNNPKCTVVDLTATFPNHETFLTGLAGAGTAADETAYRTAADGWAHGPRGTLTEFKNDNGFPAGEATAVYFNNADLKLGRDMHCRLTSDGRIACYVSNYLDKATPPAGSGPALIAAGNAHATLSNALLFATVAMEWDPSKPLGSQVQFFVYNASDTRVNEATLDSEGPKPVPQICVACHGGSYSPSDHLAHESRFLPFDIASFLMADDVFSAGGAASLGLGAFTRLNQLGQFRALNALVAQAEAVNTLPHNAVTELITGWYQNCGGVNNVACNSCLGGAGCPDSFVGSFRPGPWNADAPKQALYDNVVRPFCRGCHMMQPSFDWSDPTQLTTAPFRGAIEPFVCTSSQRRMPHAEVPFKGFWQSPVAPGQLTQAPESFMSCQR